jgi:hypothetical protein
MNRKKKCEEKKNVKKKRKENWILYLLISNIKIIKFDEFINITRENKFLRINNNLFVDKIYS